MLLLATLIEMNNRNIVLFPKFSLLIGGASYSLYLSHNIILLIFYAVGVRTAIKNIGMYQGFLMSIVILIILIYSVLHYKFIETPLMNFAKRVKPNW